MAPLVSVVIPAYRQAAYLGAALRSVLAQAGPPLDVIVVDDGSPDDTGAVAAGFGDQIRYIAQPNGGASKARNTGLRAARGEFVALLDADDLCLPGRLASQAALLQANPGAGLVASDALHLAEEQLIGLRSLAYGRPPWRSFRWHTVEYCATTSTVMLRRSAWEAVGGFEESLHREHWGGEDWLFFVRLSLAHDLLYQPFPTIIYRVHPASGSTDAARVHAGNRRASALAVEWEHFPRYPAHFRARLLYYRCATAWRTEPRPAALRYLLRAVLTDPGQLPYGWRVLGQGLRGRRP
ncbi:MAG: glycosyltransferase family 2 protein [Anaerolineales bacterium]|nr:glycosyltransferase family 2 protein [Anaerolineales bacterium]